MRRYVSIILAIISLICLFSGCAKNNLTEASNGVKLPKYTDLELTKTEYVVSEQFLDNMMNELVKHYATTEKIEEGIVLSTDALNISYTTHVGEQELTEASVSNITFKLGEKKFIEDFEKAMLGKNIGETFDLEISYPINSTYSILDGKTVVHHVTIHYVERLVYPELTDELIQTYVKNSTAQKEANCKTVAEYRAYLKERYEFTYADMSNQNLAAEILDYLLENSQFPELSSTELDNYVDDKYDYYVKFCQDNGFTIEQYFEIEGITEEEFKNQLRKDGEVRIKKTMIVAAIQELENITLSENDYSNYLNYLMVYYQFDSIEELNNSIAELNAEKTIRSDATHDLVLKFLLKNQNLKVEKKDLLDLAKEGTSE